MVHAELEQHFSANGKDRLEYYGLIHTPEGKAKAWCFLYTKRDEQSKEVLELLLAEGVKVWECAASSAGEPMEIPTLITREGQLSGIEGARAWLGWFVNDPDYQKLVATKRK